MTRQSWNKKPLPPGERRTLGVHCSRDTIQALWKYAQARDMSPSWAAHSLLREALGLPDNTLNNPN